MLPRRHSVRGDQAPQSASEKAMPHRRPSPVTHPTARLVGQSAAIQALQAQIRRLTAFDTVDNLHAPTLLLQGETGTGKG